MRFWEALRGPCPSQEGALITMRARQHLKGGLCRSIGDLDVPNCVTQGSPTFTAVHNVVQNQGLGSNRVSS
jgi:hypothetical protein